MKKISQLLCMILICAICINISGRFAQAKSVASVVKHCRKIYYTTQDNLNSLLKNHVAGEYTDYYDKKKKILWKAVTYPSANTDAYLKKYTAEYFYDNTQRLIFAFAYRKKNGKVQEYRAYYGTDGKLYRFINAAGKIQDYKGGKKISYNSSSLKYELYRKGTYYLHLALE